MQCRECGFDSGGPSALFCQACGARLVAVRDGSPSPAGVQSPSAFPTALPLGPKTPSLSPDATQSHPIVPDAARPSRPAMPSAPKQPAPPGPLAASSVPADPAAPSVPAAPVSSPSAPPAKSQGGMPKAGDILADRYRVEKYLGQGSLCNSFLCRDLKAGNREVVFKAMHPRKAAEPGLAESFLFLAQSVAKYDRRGIAKTYESGTFAGVPYYTMEWVSGMPLRMWLMERLTFENRVLPGLGLVRSLIDVFEAIHELGCYGCLKPENVFVTLSGPVVTDFGVVGFLSPQEFEFNSYARRYLPYMAPELRQDWSNLIPHSDYYSLGAILYEILAGRAPSAPLRLPSELSDQFGIEADEVVLKALAPKPLDRFGTLEAFRAAVESLQAAMLAGSSAGVQPGQEGSRSMLIASESSTVHNPDETFQAPQASAAPMVPAYPADARAFESPGAVPSPFADSGLNGHGGQAHGIAAGSDAPGPNPYRGFGEMEGVDRIRSAFPTAPPSGPDSPTAAPLDPREGEAAHSMRRFANPSAAALHEASATGPAAGYVVGASTIAVDGASAAPGGWLEAQGASAAGESPEAEVREEPIPAWLWISIALAGCCMVVLSAYFGLLLQN